MKFVTNMHVSAVCVTTKVKLTGRGKFRYKIPVIFFFLFGK